MWANKALPEFGCLRGVKVAHATQAIAGPFGAQILAEFGADVLWLESALAPDTGRSSINMMLDGERRNQRTLALNIPTEEGKEILSRILKDCDVYIENTKGGQYEKWGLSDEALWAINPRLIIAHVSGFGQTGVQEYLERPTYDAIAQAYSGYTALNANATTAPYAAPNTADYSVALWQVIGILAALHRVQKTGVGESIDIAMFECMMKIQNDQTGWFSNHIPVVNAGLPHWVGGWGCFRCNDGEYLQLCFVGAGVLKKAIMLLGLEYGSADFPQGIPIVKAASPAGKKLMDAIDGYLKTRTAAAAEKEMLAAGLAVAKVNTLGDLENDPHVLARGTIEEWESFDGKKIRSVGVVPRFKNNPGRVWRALPRFGMDNDEVLQELGYGPEEIRYFYEKGTINKHKR